MANLEAVLLTIATLSRSYEQQLRSKNNVDVSSTAQT
jgi:hypothetical protein